MIAAAVLMVLSFACGVLATMVVMILRGTSANWEAEEIITRSREALAAAKVQEVETSDDLGIYPN